MGSLWRPGYSPVSVVFRNPLATAASFFATQACAVVLEPLTGVQAHTELTMAFGIAAGGYCCTSRAFQADLAHVRTGAIAALPDPASRAQAAVRVARGCGAMLVVISLGLGAAQAVVNRQDARGKRAA
mmetsp:Transcript_19861/g.62065  ORF Transcript_19861/g.62065 Transcript_19861/m.62065 type:complete len:128 (-) Transcript_19861:1-384(-)